MKKLKSLFVMSGVAAAAVLAFSAPAQAGDDHGHGHGHGSYSDDDRYSDDDTYTDSSQDVDNNCGNHSSLIAISALNNLLGGDDVTVICNGSNER